MTRLIIGLGALVLVTAMTHADDPPGPPDWFLNEIETLTAGSGRWVTSNEQYQSDDEPYDHYVTEWRASFGGTTMTGRLYGLIDGEASPTFWEFRQYWHPGKDVAVVEQFGGGGRIGLGTAWHKDGTTRSEQVFHAPDGSSSTVGHQSRFPDERTHVTESFDVKGSSWTPRRSYTWYRKEVVDSD